MKHFLLTLLVVLSFTVSVNATNIMAATSGAWESASTWSPAQVPGNNDIVTIPYGKTVTITTNLNNPSSFTELRVAGILQFVGGGAKVSLNSSSVIFVYPTGQIQASQNSQEIVLGGTAVMNASNSGTVITGPSVARATSTSSSTSSSTSPTGFAPYTFNVLPVKFIVFTAVRQGSDVVVQWSTATEQDALQYDIEMSTDGRNWSLLATKKAAGNSNTQIDYQYTARIAGTLQLRIKQIDIDGKFTYTNVRLVKGGTDGTVSINAAAGRLLLVFGQEVKGATLRVMNLNGQVLQEQKINSAFGQVIVPTSQKGLCLVAIVTENEIAATQKVML